MVNFIIFNMLNGGGGVSAVGEEVSGGGVSSVGEEVSNEGVSGVGEEVSGGGEEVSGGGEDGGSVDGLGEDGGVAGIHGNPCLINRIALSREARASPSLSLRGGSINELYLGPLLPPSVKFLPLRVAPNIKVTT